MFRRLALAAVASLTMMGAASCADGILGDWKTDAGSTAGISSCGSSFCIRLKTGAHAGKSIGKFQADGNNEYSGTITDPSNDKTYSGRATLSGSSLRMKGCVLGGLICRSQNWKRL